MAKHFVVFIHGVNVRSRLPEPNYADTLIAKLKEQLSNPLVQSCNFIPLYWGDVNANAESALAADLKANPIWNSLFLQDLRLNQVMQFVGDAALYISTDLGALVVERIKSTAFEQLTKAEDTKANYIHLVTHSWGTIILFDILFASRWDSPSVPGYADVQDIRDVIFGLGSNPETGFYLGSITTMGSPIALFGLMSEKLTPEGSPESSHDVTNELTNMLTQLKARMNTESYKLQWLNQVHPGDLIAWPIETLMNSLVPNLSSIITVADQLVEDAGPWKIAEDNIYTGLISAGDAHGSYWNSTSVAQRIASQIEIIDKNEALPPNKMPPKLKAAAGSVAS